MKMVGTTISTPFVYSQKYCSLKNFITLCHGWYNVFLDSYVALSEVIEYLQSVTFLSNQNTKGNHLYFLKRHNVKFTKIKNEF